MATMYFLKSLVISPGRCLVKSCIVGANKMDNKHETLSPALVSENYVALFFRGGTKICNDFFGLECPPPPFPRKFIAFPLKITQKICNEIVANTQLEKPLRCGMLEVQLQ